jgi:hypothetical protein
MRCLSARKIEHHFLDVTPAPPFRRIIGLDYRVAGRVKMFCCVPVRRLIAATDMATGAADPQVQPGVAQFQTFFAPQGARNNVTDCREMFAKYRHVLLRRFVRDDTQFMNFRLLVENVDCSALLHQRGSDLSVEMRVASSLVVESIKYRERGRSFLNRIP